MRIGVLAPELTEAHGWGRYTVDLMTALHRQGDIEFVIAASKASPDDGGVPNVGYHPILPPLAPAKRWTTPRSMTAIPRLWAILRDCNVVLATAEHYLPAAALAGPGKPLSVIAHGTYLPLAMQRRGVGPLFRWAVKRATVLTVSGYTRSVLEAALPGIQPVLIGSAVQVERFAAAPDVLPEKAGPTVLGVGVNKGRKGFHILLEAIAQVRQQIPEVQCVIIGDNSNAAYQSRLHAIIEKHDLGRAVHILGRVPEETLIGWYHAADVFALPSINAGDQFEGFGLVHLEAGAANLPAIGTLGCGAEDAIDDGETGYLVPQNDPVALAGAITRLLQDDDLRARLGAANRRKAEAFTWDGVAAKVRSIYEAHLAR